MLDLGIPEHQIGYPDPDSGVPWRAFFPHEGKGGSVIGDKIAVDSGVFNPDLLTTNYGKEIGEQWEKHRLRDRLDAVIAPECAEASGVDQRSGCQTWFLVSGSIRAMICWSSSASWGRARTGHHVIDGALKLDAKSSGHFPSRAR